MRFIERLREERGMTMIELLAAAVICAVGVMGTIAVLDTSREVSVKAEFRETMAAQAERELERVMELPWDELAHTSAPPGSASPSNPAYHVDGNSYAYDRSNPSATETFAIAPTGQVAATSSTWSDGQSRLSGRVYRFVTDKTAYARRVTIVVTGDGAKAPASILVSSIKTTPNLD